MEKSLFIARQPILNKHSQIVGYELLFRGHAAAQQAEISNELDASTQVLANILTEMGTSWVLGDKLAFLNVSAEGLKSDFLDLLPTDRVVLEIAPNVAATPEVEDTLQNLQKKGFSFCLDDFNLSRPRAALLSWATYVKVDISTMPSDELTALCKKVDPREKQIIAKRVETKEEFQAGLRLGISYFQGYYFARPVTLGSKVVNPAVVNIMELLKMVRAEADVRELEGVMKRDATLLFKLLRYLNSPGVGLRREIRSFREALTVLGYEKLFRWLSLLMVTAGTSSAAPALARTAITRGFMAQNLATTMFSSDAADELFMVGAFSLLDAMFEMPKEAIFDKIMLPTPVKDAIMIRQGVYAPALDVVEWVERDCPEALPEKIIALNVSAQEITDAHLSALARAEQLSL